MSSYHKNKISCALLGNLNFYTNMPDQLSKLVPFSSSVDIYDNVKVLYTV